MDDPTLDPERLLKIGSVLSRYAMKLAPGHRIRMGMEGDPCTPYRAAEEAPSGTVVDVERGRDGAVRFRVELDGSHAILDLDNRNVAADRIWEIEPAYLETFRGHGEGSDETAGGAEETAERDAGPHEEPRRVETSNISHEDLGAYRGAISRIEQQLLDMEASNHTFRETMASTVRALASDLVRTSQGVPCEFADQYVDRYDLAVAERVSGMAEDAEGFRAAGRPSRGGSSYQAEKVSFEDARFHYGNVEEDSSLSE